MRIVIRVWFLNLQISLSPSHTPILQHMFCHSSPPIDRRRKKGRNWEWQFKKHIRWIKRWQIAQVSLNCCKLFHLGHYIFKPPLVFSCNNISLKKFIKKVVGLKSLQEPRLISCGDHLSSISSFLGVGMGISDWPINK